MRPNNQPFAVPLSDERLANKACAQTCDDPIQEFIPNVAILKIWKIKMLYKPKIKISISQFALTFFKTNPCSKILFKKI